MSFVSILFLACFLPVMFLLYSIFRSITVKNVILLAGSLLFYACYDVKYLAFLAFAILVTYCAGLIIEKTRNNRALSRLTITIALLLNMGMLAVCKYSSFVAASANSILAKVGWTGRLIQLPGYSSESP